MSFLVSLEEVVRHAELRRREGKKIVTTNGCFDILHQGHVEYLGEAKSNGDILIVGINSDDSTRKLKGDQRPLKPERERAIIVDALKPVDYTFVFDEETPCDFIRAIRPDVHVKGGDDAEKELPEREAVEQGGGKVVVVSYTEVPSTTDFVNNLKGMTNGDPKR
jgi:glycerol-3-phosphate cytidylyltransferase